MRPLATTRGTHVARQGSDADAIFFLQRGTVEVLHLGNVVATIAAPATFAEAALLRVDMEGADKRMSCYRTSTNSMCVFLLQCFFRLIVGRCRGAALGPFCCPYWSPCNAWQLFLEGTWRLPTKRPAASAPPQAACGTITKQCTKGSTIRMKCSSPA